MSVFTHPEIDYLTSQRLGRLATVGPDGRPHVVPVGFRYNAELDAIDIGTRPLASGEAMARGTCRGVFSEHADQERTPPPFGGTHVLGEAVTSGAPAVLLRAPGRGPADLGLVPASGACPDGLRKSACAH